MKFSYQNTELSIEERVNDLVGLMTVDEKISQMLHFSPSIDRLEIPAYTWWNEALHGVARAGTATVFPQAIGMAASFDEELVHKASVIISDEARAKHHEFLRKNDTGIYKGLTMWSPNINIFRDPRWGRGHETFGEDPYLTARMGCAFVKGMQGQDKKYLKTIATPKHFAVHSGPENLRHTFDAVVSKKDLRETYLPAFRDCVIEGGAYSVMGAYNRTNGEPCCGSHTLLQKILRDEWGFEGFVVSDCHAICDFHLYHKITDFPHESAAMAVKNGCDLNCGQTYAQLRTALEEGLITEEEIDISVKRLFKARFLLGMFDPPENNIYANIPYEINDCKTHRDFSVETAKKTVVLLKNDGILPLKKDIRNIAVVGPNADDRNVLLANYNGIPSRYSTILEGIIDKLPNSKIHYSVGCHICKTQLREDETLLISEAVSCAEMSDVVIVVTGLNATIEGEEADPRYPEFGGGDRNDISLPGRQNELIEAMVNTKKPVIIVNLSGSSVDLCYAHENCNAVIQAWYPGALGGMAVADILFGDFNPSAKLPVTFYKSTDQLPAFEDYEMSNRTYRYIKDEPLYPFGYGLSYSDFSLGNLTLSSESINPQETIHASIDITNNGPYDGANILQVYIKTPETNEKSPIWELKKFKPVYLKNGETETVKFVLDKRKMSYIDEEGKRVILPGKYRIYVGTGQPDERTRYLTRKESLMAELTIIGTEPVEIDY